MRAIQEFLKYTFGMSEDSSGTVITTLFVTLIVMGLSIALKEIIINIKKRIKHKRLNDLFKNLLITTANECSEWSIELKSYSEKLYAGSNEYNRFTGKTFSLLNTLSKLDFNEIYSAYFYPSNNEKIVKDDKIKEFNNIFKLLEKIQWINSKAVLDFERFISENQTFISMLSNDFSDLQNAVSLQIIEGQPEIIANESLNKFSKELEIIKSNWTNADVKNSYNSQRKFIENVHVHVFKNIDLKEAIVIKDISNKCVNTLLIIDQLMKTTNEQFAYYSKELTKNSKELYRITGMFS